MVLGPQPGQGIGVVEGGLEPFEGNGQRRPLRGRGLLGEEPAGQPFELDPHLVDAARLVRGDPRHHRAAMRHDLDEPLRLQLPQRLADERPADAGHLAEFALRQALAGPEAAQSDGVADALGDALAQRRGDLLDPEIGPG